MEEEQFVETSAGTIQKNGKSLTMDLITSEGRIGWRLLFILAQMVDRSWLGPHG
uniref:Uncharacterized protein n=1 Tax=Onchocerca volvulus TaxID=6282 RepID=A0A8R1TWV6_ONCVO